MCVYQGNQSRIGSCNSLTSETIYFGIGQYRRTVLSLPLFYIYIIINIKVYLKTLPQFRTNYSWFYTLASIKKKKKKHNIKNRKLNCSLHTKKTNNTNKLMQISFHSTLTKIQKLQN